MKHCKWPTDPLGRVQVCIDGVSMMASPERAYFDAMGVIAAIAAEREACAKLCDDLWKQEADAAANGTQKPKYHDAIECAYAIRSRSNTP